MQKMLSKQIASQLQNNATNPSTLEARKGSKVISKLLPDNTEPLL
jgi:hypothetical protein